jgi:hypothetical protein
VNHRPIRSNESLSLIPFLLHRVNVKVGVKRAGHRQSTSVHAKANMQGLSEKSFNSFIALSTEITHTDSLLCAAYMFTQTPIRDKVLQVALPSNAARRLV